MLLSRQNRLLPVLAIVTGLLFLLVLQRACSSDDQATPVLKEVPSVVAADADTPSDTLNTLTANVAAMTAELKGLRSSNADLQRANQALVVEARVSEAAMQAQISEALETYQRNGRDDNALTDMRRRLDDIAAQLKAADYSEIPIGFGLPSDATNTELSWVEPLDSATAGSVKSSRTSQPPLAESIKSAVSSGAVFTVPRNATLMGSTAMTAMLGRVPVRGEVRDPMPFKLITGRDNLTANGHTVPGVAGMIWSGTAIGDWTLSCVTGRLHSVTYVFADGRIRTVSSDENAGERGNTNRALGWISDAHGVPCIAGERKSNASAFLSQRIATATVEAAAQAAAAAESTRVITDNGSISNTVDGKVADFVLGRSLAQGSSEIADWLAERQAQNFDAIFVPAGAAVVIHVDQEIPIDLTPNARKTDYAHPTHGAVQHRLD